MANRDRLNRNSLNDTACVFVVLLFVHHQALRSCTVLHNDTAYDFSRFFSPFVPSPGSAFLHSAT